MIRKPRLFGGVVMGGVLPDKGRRSVEANIGQRQVGAMTDRHGLLSAVRLCKRGMGQCLEWRRSRSLVSEIAREARPARRAD
jgi:hypothetical protein